MDDVVALTEANRRLAEGLDLIARSWHEARHTTEGSFDSCRKNICTDARRLLQGEAIAEPEPHEPVSVTVGVVAHGDPVRVDFLAS